MGYEEIYVQRNKSYSDMHLKPKANDCVVRFANVNGTGSASANGIFAKALFRMGVPISAKNIFPSNIQGLPTWYEVRINENGFIGRREGIDVMVAVNPQSFHRDIENVRPGGYLIYDSSKPLHDIFHREDIHFIGVPMMKLSMEKFQIPRQQQLFKNIIYLGAVVTLLDMDMAVVKEIIAEQFAKKEKLIPPNYEALDIGANYVKANLDYPLPLTVKHSDKNEGKIFIDGNAATALGLLYGGATVAAWYPITPSTSVAKAFTDFSKKYRVDPETGKMNVAIIQAEDELAAIGMVIGAAWNGSRAFTATSGAGVSLMNEFIGLAYFAEIPVALINVQRGGPSTGMPTRTQQADVMSSAYASHGDTKHVLLFPSTPKECFEMAVQCLDLSERLQTPVILMSDLDLGMNEHISDPFEWDPEYNYDRGKVYSAEDLERIESFGRYLDVDGDGIPYRTYPGTHPTKGSFFTRGTSRDEYARYTEQGDAYVRNVDRLTRKWETSKSLVPKPKIKRHAMAKEFAIIFFGTTYYAALEAMELLTTNKIYADAMCIKAFPFTEDVEAFVSEHETIFVIEQNKDGQMKQMLVNELNVAPSKFVSVLNYDGMPITADKIFETINLNIKKNHPELLSI